MGWLWSSSNDSKDKTTTTPSNDDDFSPPPTSPSTLTPTPSQPPQTKLKSSPEEDEEALLLAFLSELESEPSSPSPTPLSTFASITSPRAPPPSSRTPPQTLTSAPQRLTPAHVYPSTLSCRAAFDHAFACQSLGGQFLSVYRYGLPRSCADSWSQFWFCVRTNRRRMEDHERVQKVLARAREREERYRVGPSSQDVWRQRELLVSGAFEGDLEALEKEEGMRWGG